MELTPQLLAEVEFRDTLRGYDRDEVDTFLEQVGVAIAQLQGRLKEAIARAEVAEDRAGAGSEPDGVTTETITRTLVLAQQTADGAVAEAEADAARMVAEAREEAERLRTEAESDRAAMLAETENEVREVAEESRQTLMADLEHLEVARADAQLALEQLEGALTTERSKLVDAADYLMNLADSGVLGDPAMVDADGADEAAASDHDDAPAEAAHESDDAGARGVGDGSDTDDDHDVDADDVDAEGGRDAVPAADESADETIDLSDRSGPYDIEGESVERPVPAAHDAPVDLTDEAVDSLAGGAAGPSTEPTPGPSVFDDHDGGPSTQAVDVIAVDDDGEPADDVFVRQLRQAVSPGGEHEGETMAEFFEPEDGPRRLFGRDSD